jgi:hypothetical protein
MEPIVFSMSAIAAFKRCRKSYEISYEMLLEPKSVPSYVTQGSDIHTLLHQAAKGETLDKNNEMYEVVESYLREEPLPKKILSAEESAYTLILPAGEFYDCYGIPHEHPDVYIRTTFDLVYEERGMIVGRDYKSFATQPTYDLQLDFQTRIYIAALIAKYQTDRVRFEHENIRRTPPSPLSHWSPAQCYIRNEVAFPKHEIRQQWDETKDVVRDMLRARVEQRFYRQDLKTGPHSCNMCFVRDLCIAQLRTGALDEQTISLLANRREKERMP